MLIFPMLATLMKNLFRGPVTRRYPFVPRTYYRATRGRIAITIAQCIFCGICQRKCPTGALVVNRETKEWTINRLRCTACGACVENCPKKCLRNENQYTSVSSKPSVTDSFKLA